ncbi:MAG: YdcF family protein [Planctomycetota bacterium]|jgi:hypothetical protein
MRPPVLWRRRSVWLPTLRGWLILLALFGTGTVLAGRGLHAYLAVDLPVGADLLVVEGWLGDAGLDQAIERFGSGDYSRVVISGGPITHWADRLGFDNYADLAADALVRRGIPSASVFAVPAPASAQNRTFLSAVMVREWAQSEGLALDAIDVYSSGAHARRTRLLYRMAFGPGVRVGILAAQPEDYDPRVWWRTSSGAKNVVGELLGLLWTECCFWPGPPGSVDEKWAVPGRGAAPR